MKTKHLFFVSMLGLAAGLSVQAAAPRTLNGANDRAEVIFFEPQKFTDAADSYMGDAARSGYLYELRDHVLRTAQSLIPEGYKLAVTFNDIDLAGEFEPWRTRGDDIRIVKEIYAPRIKLVFRLTDAQGNVVNQGNKELFDPNFMMKLTMGSQSDSLRYEKQMLDDWMRSVVPVQPKA